MTSYRESSASSSDVNSLVDDYEDETKFSLQELVTKVEIVGSKKVQKTKSEKLHIQYVLHVQTTVDGLSWNVHRRYNQFLQLHNDVKKQFREKDLPPFPPKHSTLNPLNIAANLSQKYSHESIEQRSAELDKYIRALVKIPALAKSEYVCNFLVGTYHDIFQRLKMYSTKCHKQEVALNTGEQQRQNAVAQLDSALRRNEQLQAKVQELEIQNRETGILLNQSNTSTSKNDNQIQSLRDLNRQERERYIEELRECNANWEKKTASMGQVIYEAQEAHNKSLKSIQTLEEQIKVLKQQKKVLVKGIKDLREKVPNTTVIPLSPVSSNPNPSTPPQ